MSERAAARFVRKERNAVETAIQAGQPAADVQEIAKMKATLAENDARAR